MYAYGFNFVVVVVAVVLVVTLTTVATRPRYIKLWEYKYIIILKIFNSKSIGKWVLF